MAVFRLVIGLLVAAILVCLALGVATHNPVWKRRATVIAKWTLIAALGFAAVLVLERAVLVV